MDILTTFILPVLATPLADAIKKGVSKLFGRSIEEEIKLMQAEVEKLKALAELDKPSDNISQWVANLRASFRYIIVGVVVLVTCIIGVIGYIYSPESRPTIINAFLEFSGACTSFIIGNRIYLSFKK
ncbi:MAG: hypothetical protein N2505_05910 [Endomicrobia bacterium]|nr:hypothetical protein [Endomicrobiia bacterium]